MSFRIDLAYIRETIFKMLPPDAGVTRLEFEGPEIAIYVSNPRFLVENTGIIGQIARTIKKRIVIRTDPSIRKDKKWTEEYIRKVVPEEAGLQDIQFDDVLGEVVIKVKNPLRLGEVAKKILVETGWRPRFVRAPPMRSRIYEEIMAGYLARSSYRLRFLRELGEAIHRDVLLARNSSNYVRVTFLGAAREVGRSAILVETAESRILLDFGLNPGRSLNPNAYPRLDLLNLDPEDIDAVIVTHAHLDHCGLVPYLFKYGYRGPVYTTEATRDLMVLLLKDFLEVAEREGNEPPFTMKDVEKMLLHTIALKYNIVTDISPDIRLTFYNAGHILGSAIVHLHIGNGFYNIVYTGDFKFAKTRLLERAEHSFPRVDTLIMESTYGSTVQPSRAEAEAQLIEIVKKTLERGGKVLIPTLSVGRAQEIMLVLADAIEKGLISKDVRVYIEGMIHEVTAIHTAYPELLSKELRQALYSGRNPFEHDNFVKVEGKEARTELVETGKPCIILATSGMLTGGPAVEYFKLMAPDSKNSLIFVSYQVEGTLGRKIKDGAREIPFVEHGKVKVVRVNMEVYSVEGFSGHSDKRQLIEYLERISPKPTKLFLVHGEQSSITSLRDSIISASRKRKRIPRDLEIHIPAILDSYTLSFSV